MSSAPQISINLLDQDVFSQSGIGKVLMWALSIGRYIVVFTELIVIISFLSRFKLDRDLTDLNEGIAKQKAIILSYGNLETKFLQTQELIKQYKENRTTLPPKAILDILGRTLPPDVKINQLGINEGSFRISAIALSPDGFVQFIKALNQATDVRNITLGGISSENRGITLEFELLANLASK